ncbi:LicD family-domain-containing protein [Lipomyces japonicus]|uniref:LicD family-domain-containing protein n=1 Tax=Lipomyces japonicus TaxID=56871 RepID=UPI0034CF9F81
MMLRRALSCRIAAVLASFILFFTFLLFFLSVPSDADDILSPMSVTHEQFYIPLPRRPIRPPPKYFFEAAMKKNKQWFGLHYDRRFFKGELKNQARETAIRDMLDAWFSFINKNGFESWIAHGSLLGWWWNGEPMPWDVDVDVQMMIRTMKQVSDKFNGTYFTHETQDHEASKYYIDINPYYVYRSRSNGQNVIDGRFVDTSNGLYIDITALSETDPIRHPNIISCKNDHKYRVDDILPLRETLYIGKKSYVPYEFEKILQKEYSRKALTNPRYGTYIFVKGRNKWITMSEYHSMQPKKPAASNGGPERSPYQRLDHQNQLIHDEARSATDEKLQKAKLEIIPGARARSGDYGIVPSPAPSGSANNLLSKVHHDEIPLSRAGQGNQPSAPVQISNSPANAVSIAGQGNQPSSPAQNLNFPPQAKSNGI